MLEQAKIILELFISSWIPDSKFLYSQNSFMATTSPYGFILVFNNPIKTPDPMLPFANGYSDVFYNILPSTSAYILIF
jgi:hypothetical protein